MNHTLPPLKFGPKDLEPHISERSIEFHYGKHHQAYVNNLNKLIEGTKFEQASLEDIIRDAEGGIFNNGAQVWNHSFYFSSLSPAGGGKPKGILGNALERDFNSFSEFQEQFSIAANTLFGSGWVWLVMESQGKLKIIQESNAGNPIRGGLVPILTCDIWEHAYYLDYQNRRPDYIKSFWEIVDWDIIAERF
ncbi:MAG: superoxide dismutase [Bacteroides sp. SM23_62]|nr:MAG: superoxide dismutase [Bacteroides sp. SM23_62]